MKKLVSIIMLIILSCALVACGTNKENISSGKAKENKDYFEWEDTTIIVGYTDLGLKQTELVIPEECTEVMGLRNNTTVKKIRFINPDTSIARNAFSDCINLSSIELPKNLKEIGAYTFGECSSLKSITIPDSVTKIDDNAFFMCHSLESIEFGTGLEEIGNKAFYNCTALKELIFPDSLKKIDNDAFFECTSLTEIKFGTGLKTIGNRVFEQCASLKTIHIPEGVEAVGANAFSNYANGSVLEAIYLPSSLKEINRSAFVQTHHIKIYVVEGSYADNMFDKLAGTDYFTKCYQ